ncbi:MAG: hypothetical protein CM15mV56_330 [uncultured marine virus]|nr:MAG: hypothetical protein CM15mV56_330 [uncultured marine virus]
MAIKQAPSNLMSMFQGAPTSSLPVASSVERITDLPSIAGDLVDPSASAKIFDPSSFFLDLPTTQWHLSGPLLASGSFLGGMQDGGLIEYQNGGSVNIQQILQDADYCHSTTVSYV